MSELSTVAIKDGHRGHLPHHHNPMDAERADRISRLAGLERVVPGSTAPRNPSNLAPGGYSGSTAGYQAQAPAYFDQNNNPQIMRERSTVGSASATGSVGGRTTWASGSDVYDPDKMSEDRDIPASADGDRDAQMEAETTSSVGGVSDEASSLVGFGEGARTPARTHSAAGGPGSPVTGKIRPSASWETTLSGTTADCSPMEEVDWASLASRDDVESRGYSGSAPAQHFGISISLALERRHGH